MRSRPVLWIRLCGCLLVALALPTLLAQSPPSSSSSKPIGKSASPGSAALDSGNVKDNVYRNSGFGFACKIPQGWVLRTDEMNVQKNDEPGTGNANKSPEKSDGGRVLLAAFSRPPEAHGEEVNSSILIVGESAAAYPGLKDAAQYFGPVTEVAKGRGFDVDEEPYEFAVGNKIVVRGDFEKDVGSRVMHQSTLVMLARGYVVSFTFLGGTENEVDELVGGLSFAAAKATK